MNILVALPQILLSIARLFVSAPHQRHTTLHFHTPHITIARIA